MLSHAAWTRLFARDPAVACLLTAALAGAWWPARRALQIDPAQVLRE